MKNIDENEREQNRKKKGSKKKGASLPLTPFPTMIPMVFMLFITGWAMLINLNKFFITSNWLLLCIGLAVFLLEIWMVVESTLVLKKLNGEKTVNLKQYG